jgi:hypothetical protein
MREGVLLKERRHFEDSYRMHKFGTEIYIKQIISFMKSTKQLERRG